MSSNFKIKNEKQLAELKKLKLSEIKYDPSRSDVEPLSLQQKAETTPDLEAAAKAKAEAEAAILAQAELEEEKQKAKEARIKKMKSAHRS